MESGTAGDDPLEARSVAAAVAPIIDRLRMAIVRRVPEAAAKVDGLLSPSDPSDTMVLSMLRNLLPDRAVPTVWAHAPLAYWPPGQVDAALDRLATDGFVVFEPDGELELTDRGRSAVLGLRGVMQSIVDELWASSGPALPELAELAERAIAAVLPGEPGAFPLLAPPYEPEGTSPAMLLAERLTPLRFHRYDAHVAAWSAAGLTAAEVQALAPGPEREAIEDATNDRAAAPYEALSRAERFALVSGLGALDS